MILDTIARLMRKKSAPVPQDLSDLETAIRLHEAGKLDEAKSRYETILRAAPDDAEANHLLGLVAHQRGEHQKAVELIAHAITLNAKRALFHFNLGNALDAIGNTEAAITAFETAVSLATDHAPAWCNLGCLRWRLGQSDGAEEALRKAVELAPKLDQASVALVDVSLTRLDLPPGRKARLAEILDLIAQRNPEKANPVAAQRQLGEALYESDRLTEAADHFRELVAQFPEDGTLHHRLAQCCTRIGLIAEALAHYREMQRIGPARLVIASSIIACMNYLPEVTPEESLQAHRDWGKLATGQVPAHASATILDPDPDRRLRVAYVSPDFRFHSVSWIFAPVLERHDANAFETFCYNSHPGAEDVVTKRLKTAANHWRDEFELSDLALADLIRNDRIDILVDLAGHTTHGRLLTAAHRPAPVQISWLGYFNTTGLEAIDAFLTDPVSSPPGQERYFVEELIRLPHTRFVFEAPEHLPEPNPLPALSSGLITFGYLNNISKLNDEVLALWSRIFASIPRARLLIQSAGIHNAATCRQVLDWIVAAGIAAERITIQAYAPVAEAARTWHEVDIALDPFPFSGGITSMDALWMGVPVVTLAQTMIAGRQTASILANLGLHQFIAEEPDQYVEVAVRQASDLAALSKLRDGMRAAFRSSPLTDYAGFTRALEKTYRDLWRRRLAEFG